MRRISLLAGVAALGLTGAVGGILGSASTNAQSAPESLLPLVDAEAPRLRARISAPLAS